MTDQVQQTEKIVWKVYTRYPAQLYFDTNIESQIDETEAKFEVVADGYGMGFGYRDHDWSCETKDVAEDLRKSGGFVHRTAGGTDSAV